MVSLLKGRYAARLATTPDDIAKAQALRALAFRGTADATLDADPYDALCQHVLVEASKSGDLVCCFRMLTLQHGGDIDKCYSAQFYELNSLRDFDGPMIEMGRFCIHPDHHDPDILRVAWGAMTRYVDAMGGEMLFGCSSFKGTSSDSYKDAFALLKDRHIAPKRFLPRIKAPNVFRFAQTLARFKPDGKRAMKAMPPLLRSYLMMGGWVSDHAVVDNDLDTMHVFTALEIKSIPPARQKLLRLTAG